MGELEESLKTIGNLCAIGHILIQLKRGELLPTVLELLYIEAQQLIDEHCIVEIKQ